MTDDTRNLLQAALKLAPRERAALVEELAASLDEALFDADFIEMLERRADDVIAGRSKSSSWDEVEARIKARARDGS